MSVFEYYQETIGDLKLFASRVLHIQTITSKTIKLEYHDVQLLLHEIIEHIRSQGHLLRLYILKARREGVSTYICSRCYWKTTTRENFNSTMVTHEPDATDYLFNMHKRFLGKSPDMFQPSTLYNNKKILEFNTQHRDGLDSAIRVGTAGKEDFGSGQMIQSLHLSELSKWPAHIVAPLMDSLLQCVPDTLDSEIFIESTAKGVGNAFHTGYLSCRYRVFIYLDENRKPAWRIEVNEKADPSNVYYSVFIPWFVFSDYYMDGSQLVPTKEEEELMALHNLVKDQIAWRRYAIANKCKGNIKVFMQEYPATPEEAFISTGETVFDNIVLQKLKEKCVPPTHRYEIQMFSGNLVACDDGRFKVWKEPVAGRRYIVSGDVAEGIPGKHDFSCLDVIDVLTGEQCATWHGKMDADEFGVLLMIVASRYNYAWIAPERNNPGILTVKVIVDANYAKLYGEVVIEPPNRPRHRYGWLTTKSNKEPIMANLIAELRKENILINDIDTLDEMMVYKKEENGVMEAQTGHYDDRVMSLAIGKYVRTMPLITQGMPTGNAAVVQTQAQQQVRKNGPITALINLGGHI